MKMKDMKLGKYYWYIKNLNYGSSPCFSLHKVQYYGKSGIKEPNALYIRTRDKDLYDKVSSKDLFDLKDIKGLDGALTVALHDFLIAWHDLANLTLKDFRVKCEALLEQKKHMTEMYLKMRSKLHIKFDVKKIKKEANKNSPFNNIETHDKGQTYDKSMEI